MSLLIATGCALRRTLAVALLLIGLQVAGHAQGETVTEWKPISIQPKNGPLLATFSLKGSYRVFHAGNAFTKVQVRLEQGAADVAPEKKSEFSIEKLQIHLLVPSSTTNDGKTMIVPFYGEPSTYQLRKTTETHYEATGPLQTIVLPAGMQSLEGAFLFASAWPPSNGKSFAMSGASWLDLWTAYQAPTGDYAVEFPGPPATEESSEKMPGGQVLVHHKVSFAMGDTRAFLSSYTDFPSVSDPQSFLDEQVGKRIRIGYTLRDSQRLDIGGMPARRFVADRTNLRLTMVGLQVVRDRRLYYVASIVPLHKENAPEVQRFLNSFVLLPLPQGGRGADAQSYDQLRKWCFGNATDDQIIQGCDAFIRSGKETAIAEAFVNRGDAYKSKGQYDRALQDYDQAIKLQPNFARAFNNRGIANNRKSQYDRALQDYDQAIKLKSDFAEAFYNRGIVYHSKGQLDRAIQDYDQAIKLKPDIAEAFHGRGIVYHSKGQLDRAIQDYDRAIKLKPDFADAFQGRGAAYGDKGQNDRAIQDYDQAIKLKPDHALAFNGRGNAYDRKGQYDRAIQDYDQAIKLKPDFAEAFYSRGDAYHSKGQYDRAIQDYDQAIKLKPDFAEAFNNRGGAYYGKLQYDRAVQDYDQAIKLKPDFADAFNSRCWDRAIVGQLPAALVDCNEALRLQPGESYILDSRGFTYLKLGIPDAAIADYDAALKLDPKRAGSLYGRGLARRKKGDTAGGDADIAAAKEIQADIVADFAKWGVTGN